MICKKPRRDDFPARYALIASMVSDELLMVAPLLWDAKLFDGHRTESL